MGKTHSLMGPASMSMANRIPGWATAMGILRRNGMKINALRNNDVLPWDTWKYIDGKVMETAKKRMVLATALISRGLVVDLTSEGLGATVYQYQKKSDTTPASRSMSPLSRGQHDQPEIETAFLPLPCTFKDFDLDGRTIAMNERLGRNLVADQAVDATHVVSELIEKAILGVAADFKAGGGTVQGLLTFDDRTTGSLVAHWDDSGSDPFQDVLNMVKDRDADLHFGDSIVIVPPNYSHVLADDYNPNSANPLTIKERILKIPSIVDVIVADHLTADNVLLVELDERTIQLVVAQEPKTVQWPVQGGLGTECKTIACMNLLLRSDQNDRSGIVHYTK